MLAQFRATHAIGPAGADQRADRGAGDDVRLEAELVHRLDEGNMGEAARRTAAERDTDLGIARASHRGRRRFIAEGRNNLEAPLDQRRRFIGDVVSSRHGGTTRTGSGCQYTPRHGDWLHVQQSCLRPASFPRDCAPADVAAAEAFRPVDLVDGGIGAGLRVGDASRRAP